MKRLGMLGLALVGLGALVGGCGGGDEEAGVLAVAFRLDDGSPAMSAYIGDPAEDPFPLPTGRYYVEALDENDVSVSLGAIDIEVGEAVELPPSLAAAGGAVDAERAESMKTVANFLVDAELADYALLEVVSGGFEQPLFDPEVEIAAADLETLFGMYEGIVAQEEEVMAALAEIERRAEVSSGVTYVRSGWGPVPQDAEEDLQKARERLGAFFTMITAAQGRAEQSANPDEALASVILDLIEQGNVLEAQLASPVAMVQSTPELWKKSREWRKYAQNMAMEIPTAGEETGRQEAQQELADRIKKDLQDWLDKRGAEVTAPHVDRAVDPLAEWVFKEVVWPAYAEPAWIGGYVTALYDQWLGMGYSDWDAAKAATDLRECLRDEVAAGASREKALANCPVWHYEPRDTPTATATATPSETAAATATPAADTGWIEGYVQGIADQWLASGYGGIDVAVAADDLRQCLTDAVQGGAGRDEAIGECPLWLYEPQGTPLAKTPTPEMTTATPVSEETETPAPEPTETPAPEPTETPTPEPTETPAPQGQDVTATGQLTDLYDPSKITVNSITLRFNTQGGSVSGEAHFERTGTGSCRTVDDQYIDGTIVWTWDVVFSGNYSQDTGQLDGTAQITFRHVTCQRGAAWSEPWSATLQGGQVPGRFIEDCEWVASLYNWPTSTPECLPGAEDRFQLTVQ